MENTWISALLPVVGLEQQIVFENRVILVIMFVPKIRNWGVAEELFQLIGELVFKRDH